MSIQGSGGAIPIDGQGRGIQAPFSATQFDNTPTTKLQSPVVVSTTIVPLLPPVDKNGKNIAVNIVMLALDNDIRYGTGDLLSGAAGEPYEVLIAGATISYPVADGKTLNLLRDTADARVSFRFQLV